MMEVGSSTDTGSMAINTTSSSSRYIYFGDLDNPITANQGLNIYTENGSKTKIQSYSTAGEMFLSVGNFDQTRYCYYRGRWG